MGREGLGRDGSAGKVLKHEYSSISLDPDVQQPWETWALFCLPLTQSWKESLTRVTGVY